MRVNFHVCLNCSRRIENLFRTIATPRIVELVCFIILISLPRNALGQWSTSVVAESALYVCPGFYPGIASFTDGSSIVLGALQGYIYAQELDSFGYRQWGSPVLVHRNDSSLVGVEAGPPYYSWGGWTSDGDGGLILYWYDYRGAYNDGIDYRSDAVYAQRVDKHGTVLWAPGGVKVEGPETGKKSAAMTSDGQGGCVISWASQGFNYPGAPNMGWVKAARYAPSGQMLWEAVFDSSTAQDSIGLSDLNRSGDFLYANVRHHGLEATLIFSVRGLVDSISYWQGFSADISWKDSVLYREATDGGIHVLKIGANKDTAWNTFLNLPSGCVGASLIRTKILVSSEDGGLYYLYICGDTLYKFNLTGGYGRLKFPGIDTLGRWIFADGTGGLLTSTDDLEVQRYSSAGAPLWRAAFKIIQNAPNTYFRQYASDLHGGLITAFWETQGGIYAQHSGRNGKVGVITGVGGEVSFSPTFELRQNYPNPFNPVTTITYSLSARGRVELTIYDLLGRKVQALLDADQEPGTHSVRADFLSYPSGVYFYQLRTRSGIKTKKLTLLK